jgi:HD-GYP domain-containing protein (c-di-GMP phosphodiesterase class II)
MTHDRPYRASLGLEQAVEELVAGRGRQFDGDVVTLFVEQYLAKPTPRPADTLMAYTHGLYQSAMS